MDAVPRDNEGRRLPAISDAQLEAAERSSDDDARELPIRPGRSGSGRRPRFDTYHRRRRERAPGRSTRATPCRRRHPHGRLHQGRVVSHDLVELPRRPPRVRKGKDYVMEDVVEFTGLMFSHFSSIVAWPRSLAYGESRYQNVLVGS